jgi:hypothetical protein
MAIKFGANSLSKAYKGASEVQKVYLGGNLVYNISILPGEEVYTTPGTYSWTAPAGVTSVSVVAVGGGGNRPALGNPEAIGGSGGGGLGWKNNISVIPGQQYTVVVGTGGQTSYFIDTNTVAGLAGSSGQQTSTDGVFVDGGAGGGYVGDGGGTGTTGGSSRFYSNITFSQTAGQGGGAAGYPSGGGGKGRIGDGSASTLFGTRGGGVGIYGQGDTGADATSSTAARAGSGGDTTNPFSTPSTIQYGGGVAGAIRKSTSTVGAASGGNGAVRIVWGSGRAFPSTNVGITVPTGEEVYTTTGTYSWTAPEGVTEVSVAAIGGGGGGCVLFGAGYANFGTNGGQAALAYKNNIQVIPGQTYTVVVGLGGLGDSQNYNAKGQDGTDSYFINNSIILAGKGIGGQQDFGTSTLGTGGTFVGDGGENGLNRSTVSKVMYSSGQTGGRGGPSAGGTSGKGGDGIVRIVWGSGRAFPSTSV